MEDSVSAQYSIITVLPQQLKGDLGNGRHTRVVYLYVFFYEQNATVTLLVLNIYII